MPETAARVHSRMVRITVRAAETVRAVWASQMVSKIG